MPDLHLHVKNEYFNAHVAGKKNEEYRLYNDYWIKRFVGKEYENIYYYDAYPSADEYAEKRVILPYRGYEIKTITHPHFGTDPVKVFAIKLEGE